MSYDLEVYASRRPEVPGDVAFEVDGPLEAQDEDAPAQVVAALLSVAWTVQISTSWEQEKAALRLARTIAESGRGVVYDPQEDAIVWPRNPAKLRKVETSRETKDDGYDDVELRWLFTRELSSRDAHRLLDLLRATMPEAVPVRFGQYEPMQGKLERDGDDAFAALWDGDGDMFWTGRRPFTLGSIHSQRTLGSALAPEERDALFAVIAGRKALPLDELELGFSPQVTEDPQWLDAIVALFGRVAEALGPFFAGAYHEKRRVDLTGRHWLGIPDKPLWLAWVGEPYREAIADGPLIRTSNRPQKPGRIRWPDELVRRGARPAAVIPDLRS